MQLYFVFVAVLFIVALSTCVVAEHDMSNYYKRTGVKFMTETAQKPGIIKLKSGILVEVLVESSKPNALSPRLKDSCKIAYTGTLKSGKHFDTDTSTTAPNKLIPGLRDALQLMGEGDKWNLYIPEDLAYGAEGVGAQIPPFAPLKFEIELQKVVKGGKPISEARQMFVDAVDQGNAATEL